ncbi:cardiolipin synthase [Pseudoclavibacter sp. CFCC 14310]|uniref:cardiolipin synthase n=1 Tax=Pseudoclavibacter sp. CFCC 14310 TaxID=2615180 RepID=UPI0013014CAD|nr:cardiolipin synthase [Pseudoclavibacter sp. CFCC 14310]KAB1645574.1 cardiolipin synthase [Pseudoclavibacter sp. CFCC 14310]KAB1645967.1 cardiolipin synthase [Pseudoclavibacter sp. CFCC 14310]
MFTAPLASLLATLAHTLIVLVSAIVISLRRPPQTAIAWVLAIMFIPVVGVIAFLTIGIGRLPRWRQRRQIEINSALAARDEVTAHRTVPESPEWMPSAVRLNERLTALPMVGDNTLQLIDSYQGSLQAMIDDIDAATEYVHVEFYILVHDASTAPFFEALRRARHRGVTVRALSDHLSGLGYPGRRATKRMLSEMGAQWHAMLPLRPWRGQWQRPDMRNHRKIVTIDGKVAYTGSQNLIDDSYLKPKNLRRGLHWQELMVRVEGPLVGELDAVFMSDWFSESGERLTPMAPSPAAEPRTGIPTVFGADAQVVPSGPSFASDNSLKLFVLLIQNARHRISITSPYFVPDEATLLALLTAAARGVDVELFVSEIGDQAFVYYAQRSYYEALLNVGVSIYLYRSPTVLHSKHFSIDDEVAVIGSSNMDIRSFSLNMEISVLVRDADFVDQLRAVEADCRTNSIRLNVSDWRRRPTREKAKEGIARLTAQLQ